MSQKHRQFREQMREMFINDAGKLFDFLFTEEFRPKSMGTGLDIILHERDDQRLILRLQAALVLASTKDPIIPEGSRLLADGESILFQDGRIEEVMIDRKRPEEA